MVRTDGEAFTTTVPDLDDYTKEPPPLPPHLRHIILNKPPQLQDTAALPVPQHVALNHLYCTAIKDNMMVLGITQRYKTKFVTKSLLAGVAGCAIGVSFDPNQAVAKLVLNEDTGEYDEVKEEDWQTAWKARLDKAQSMSSEEIFMAAQGAGNTQLREGEESEASKKRRAMAGCRNDAIRKKAGGTKDVIACNSRVMSGDFGFVLDAMQ